LIPEQIIHTRMGADEPVVRFGIEGGLVHLYHTFGLAQHHLQHPPVFVFFLGSGSLAGKS
jgi:hypothetical protein